MQTISTCEFQQAKQHQSENTVFENAIPKHIFGASTQFNHLLASDCMDELVASNLLFSKCISFYYDRVKKAIDDFKSATNNLVEYNPLQHRTHRKLIDLVDLSLLRQFYEKYSDYDSARLKSLSNNGSLSWLHVPYNVHYGVELSNRQFIILKSVILGSKITNKKDNTCRLCKCKMDQYGRHALSCTMKGMMTIRHDSTCDKLFDFCEKAGMDVQKEQRYENDINGNKVRIEGRPGDIKINNYYTTANLPKDCKSRHLYVDLTFANIFAPSYVKIAAKHRGKIANQKQKHKLKKYQNNPNIFGIGIEVLGAMSSNGKVLINEIAKRMELKNNIDRTVYINQIRSNLLATMMQHNANMIIKCYDS